MLSGDLRWVLLVGMVLLAAGRVLFLDPMVQGVPLLLIPVILVFCRTGVLRARWMWCALLAYGLAKVTEGADGAIFALTREIISGHTVKHLLAAAAVLFAMMAFSRGRNMPGP